MEREGGFKRKEEGEGNYRKKGGGRGKLQKERGIDREIIERKEGDGSYRKKGGGRGKLQKEKGVDRWKENATDRIGRLTIMESDRRQQIKGVKRAYLNSMELELDFFLGQRCMDLYMESLSK